MSPWFPFIPSRGLALVLAGAAVLLPVVAVRAQQAPPTVAVRYATGRVADAMPAEGFNLRLLVTAGRKAEWHAAVVHLRILDAIGRPVLALDDAGPLTEVQLPPGHYWVDARLGGVLRRHRVDLLDGQPTDLYLHFPVAAAAPAFPVPSAAPAAH